MRVLAEVLERLGNWPAMSTMSMNIFSSSRPILSVQALTQLPLVPGLQGGLHQLDAPPPPAGREEPVRDPADTGGAPKTTQRAGEGGGPGPGRGQTQVGGSL